MKRIIALALLLACTPAFAQVNPGTSPLSYAKGGTNAATQVLARNNIFPTPTRAGDVPYWNGSIWTSIPGNNSGTNCLTENSSGVPSFGTCGGVTSFGSGARTGAVVGQADDYKSFTGLTVPYNCTISVTASGGVLTSSVKDNAGATPSSTSPCVVPFTDTAGGYTVVLVTSALTFTTAASGSTFGVPNATPFHLWWTFWNNAGTVALGASVQFNSTQILPINEGAFENTTACSACGTATSSGVYYTTAALTSKAKRIFAYTEWSSGLTVAGTWTSPSFTQLFGPGIKKPADPVQGATVTLNEGQALSSTTHTNTVIDGIASTARLQVGEPVTGTNVAANTVIATITSGTAITVNNATTGSATNTLTYSWITNNATTAFVDTNVSIPNFTLTSAANSVALSWSVGTVASAAGLEVFTAIRRGGVQVTPTFLGAYTQAGTNAVAPSNGAGADFPGSIGPFTYTVGLKASSATTVSACDTNGGCSATAAEFMR